MTMWPMPEQLDLTPAYGRTYARLDDAKADWVAGRDFKILGGPYLSIRDTETLKSQGVKTVMVWTGKREGIEIAL